MAIPLLIGLSPKPAKADFKYVILDSGMFTEEVDVGGTHTINCYRIKDHATYIAIAWGEDPENAPATITIPETITSNKPTKTSVDYTVVAVSRAGFSRCTSTTITLPQTVEDIREEAFAYCQKLDRFIIPKDVSIIAPSAFLDCRSMTRIYYSNNEGKRTMYNSKITSFGDHAFDSCVSLRKIQCPSTAVFFGQSCFQKCSTLSTFRFPVDNGENGDDRNLITVEDYAFADCTSLNRVYFDINMYRVSDYAFADSKNDLTFYFYDSEENFPNSLSALWRNKKITTSDDYSEVVYDIAYNIEKPVEGNYPGLTVTLSNAERKLDNARTNDTSVVVIPGGGQQYAVIEKFETPDEDDWDSDYYEDGILTIPDEVTVNKVTYPVKVIEANAFGENDDIIEVHFNPNLVQICNRAFWHSNNIEILDFEDCEDLVEISYALFNEIIVKKGKNVDDAINGDVDNTATKADANCNKACTSLTLPNCLQYLGNFAFFNFTRLTKGLSFKTNTNKPSKLKIIGDYAFAVYSTSSDYNAYLPSGTIAEMDVELPNSLDDNAAQSANIYHSFSFDKKGGGGSSFPTVNKSIWNRVAINKNAFDHQDGLRSITMEKVEKGGGTPHDISFGSNVFIRNNGIIRFEASENLCLMGTEIFKSCKEFREVFLCADRARNNTHYCDNEGKRNGGNIANPWGVGDGINNKSQNIFHEQEYYNLVIYIKRSGTNNYPNSNAPWYGINKYQTDKGSYITDEIGRGRRPNIPAYTVDWTISGNVKYWHINDASDGVSAHDEVVNIDEGPKTQAEYNNGYISFVKGSDNKYIVARYFTDGSAGNYAKLIDLTSSTLNGMPIAKIGHEAFGGDCIRGLYFVLPSTITTIEERAFYRYNSSQGVRIITFENTNDFKALVSSNSTDGYCRLPKSVTRIERVCFYNNYFKQISLGVDLSFIGNAAFYSNNSIARNESFVFTDYDDTTATDTNSKFEIYNNGIYHKSKKMLLHQANGINDALTIKSGTKYIGYRAVAGSKYTSIDFGDSTERIYGYAFKNCKQLKSISNVSKIISIATSDSYPTSDDDYDRDDGKDTVNDSNAASFENCSELQVDFSEMTALKKIGSYAFKGCSKLPKSSKTYTVNDASAGVVLDLSMLKGLTNIENNAFENVTSDYVIMPNTTGTNYATASNLSCKANMFTGTGSKVLCGETAQQADQGGSYWSSSKYPVGCMGNYSTVYYRCHSATDILGETAGTTRRYWTAVKTGDPDEVNIIKFESKEEALAWLDDEDNYNSQCHTFPEETVTP